MGAQLKHGGFIYSYRHRMNNGDDHHAVEQNPGLPTNTGDVNDCQRDKCRQYNTTEQ